MTERARFTRTLLEPDRSWLLQQPGAADWEAACEEDDWTTVCGILEENMTAWITEYTRAFCDADDEDQGEPTTHPAPSDVETTSSLGDTPSEQHPDGAVDQQ